FGRDLVDDQAFIHHLVVDLNAGDLGERLGQRLRLVFVNAENFRSRADLHALEGRRCLDEPFHLSHLLILGQRRRLKLVVDPLLGGVDLLRIAHGWREQCRCADRGRYCGRACTLQNVTTFDIHIPFPPFLPRTQRARPLQSSKTKHSDREWNTDRERVPELSAAKSHPQDENERGAEQRNEEAIAARRWKAEYALSGFLRTVDRKQGQNDERN